MNLIQAYGSGIEMGQQAALPGDIQWMPPGKNTITTRNAKGEPETRDIDVNAELAARVQGMLRVILDKAKSGEGDLPYFDFNHSDGEAAGHPTEFFWGGDDPKSGGIRAKLTWTSAGKAAIAGRTFRRFSPEFYVDDKDQVTGLGPNLGGLVNRAAFKRIEPIWSRDGAGPSTATPNQNTMTEAQAKQLADLTTAVSGLTTLMTNIQAKLAEPAPVTEVKAGAAATASTSDDMKTIVVLQTEVANLKEVNKVRAQADAERVVAQAVAEGRIPAQNKELADKWVNLILVDAKNAELLPPANPALQRVTGGNGATSQIGAGSGASSSGEHEFIVKAREYATTNKITDAGDAQVQFAATPAGKEAYESYRKSVRVQK